MMSRGKPIAPTYRYEMHNSWRSIEVRRGVTAAAQLWSFLTGSGETYVRDQVDTNLDLNVRVGESPD